MSTTAVVLSSGSSHPAVLAVLPARRGGGAPSFLFSSGARRGKGEEKTPMGLVAWRLGFVLLLAFEARRRAVRGDLPLMPPGRPSGLGRWHPRPPHMPRLRGARREGKRVTAPPWPGPTHARAHRALGVRAAWLVRLSRRARPALSSAAWLSGGEK
jgi:hypothetical protein